MEILAPSTIACARSRSPVSWAPAAAFSASQISLCPSNAGAVSQNSSRRLRSCPSVIGMSLFHLGFSGCNGWFLPTDTLRKKVSHYIMKERITWHYEFLWYIMKERITWHYERNYHTYHIIKESIAWHYEQNITWHYEQNITWHYDRKYHMKLFHALIYSDRRFINKLLYNFI